MWYPTFSHDSLSPCRQRTSGKITPDADGSHHVPRHADKYWTETLPLVLLGIRTSFKADLQALVAELVYGEPLRIPGELLTPAKHPADPAYLITQLRQHINRLRPVPATRHANPCTFIHKDLTNCTYIFLRQGSTCRALEPPYSGPYQVLFRKDKTLNSLCSANQSPCLPTGSSLLTYSTRTTAGTLSQNLLPPQHQTKHLLTYQHRLQLPRLHVPGDMPIFLYASPPKHQSPLGGRVILEPSMGTSHRLPNRYRGNGYPNWYQSKNLINRITVVTNNRNNTGIVTGGFYIGFASRYQQKYTWNTRWGSLR
jgi:hypothetical protein